MAAQFLPFERKGENIMTIKLPQIIEKYVDASNRHDQKSILSCFSDDALVYDEGESPAWKKGHRRLDCKNNRSIQIPVQTPQRQRRRCGNRRRCGGIGNF